MGMPAILDDGCQRLTGAELGHAITLLSAQMNAANHLLLRLIAEFDRCGAWREQGTMRSCAHWLVAHCGITLGAAREKVRVARQLEVLPEVNDVFSKGGISYSKVRAITRAACDQVATPENEGFMVHLAQQNSAGHLERLVSRHEPVAEPGLAGLLECGLEESAGVGVSGEQADSGAAPALDTEAMRELARELYWFQDEDGMWIIHAKLPPEQGQLVVKALQAVARPLAEERQEEWQAKQKVRMQAVARKLLQRKKANVETSAESSVKEAKADQVAYARAEEKNFRGDFFAAYEPGASRCAGGDGRTLSGLGAQLSGPARVEGGRALPGCDARGH